MKSLSLDDQKILNNISGIMEPRIEKITEKKLVGKRIRATLSNDKIFELWRSFMPRRKAIKNIKSHDLFSLQIYEKGVDIKNFTKDTEFEKWAALEVTEFETIPVDMESYTLAGGLYAVFLHRGAASSGPKTFQYIFEKWLPKSEYIFDYRPHFEILGDLYKNEEPDSEEEIWIPVKHK
jgi:AraC family transcriptional regulator